MMDRESDRDLLTEAAIVTASDIASESDRDLLIEAVVDTASVIDSESESV